MTRATQGQPGLQFAPVNNNALLFAPRIVFRFRRCSHSPNGLSFKSRWPGRRVAWSVPGGALPGTPSSLSTDPPVLNPLLLASTPSFFEATERRSEGQTARTFRCGMTGSDRPWLV
jgi:hypothetical protein